jgi:hypothetical protein
MLKTVSKFGRRRNRGSRGRTLSKPFVWTFSLLVFGFAAASATAAEEARDAGVVALSPQFAISDFDGDLRPDLASIQAGATASGSTDYWIHLQLSAAGRQLIRLVAPAGGLLIEARDVNGDHAVDLVLTTTSYRQPVAIFLNDGHGVFSRVEPSAFPAAFSRPAASWASRRDGAIDAVDVSPQSRTGICRALTALRDVRSQSNSISPLGSRFLLDSFLVSHAGRAPPA